MPTKAVYSSVPELLRDWLRKLRIPIVFLLSAAVSYCGLQEGNLWMGKSALAPKQGRVRVALWDADLMADGSPMRSRGDVLGTFGDDVDPDVLVVYDVPDFAALLKLRDALHLYGYSAAMSNFFCQGAVKGPRWPIEIAILSRYPIDEAVEYDPPTDQLRACPGSAPLTEGPAVAARRTMTIPQSMGLSWPDVGDRPLAGPGFMVARIESARLTIVAVRVGLPTEYPSSDPLAINRMRQAITAGAAAWIWREKDAHEDDHILAVGDFGIDPGERVVSASMASGNSDNNFDGADSILTQGVIGGGAQALPRSDYTTGGLRMVNLTRALVAPTAGGSGAPHSGRIYLWSRQPGVFGLAERAARSYVSRSFPLVVASSGGTCAIDPLLTWMRRGPTFAGLSKQVFTAAGTALELQLKAMNKPRGGATWMVSLDLDDIVIDNSPFLYEMARRCQLPTVADWDAWVSSGQAKLLPGVADFVSKVRALAADGRGRILIFTKRRADQAADTMSLLTKLGIADGPDDPLVQVDYATTLKTREAAWRRMNAAGRRIVLVVGNDTRQFPNDARLKVGGTVKSCPNPAMSREQTLRLLGPQTPRFGICYFLIPVHVL